ncbi:MAG: RnfABCDGE type electron transport complex subunit D [Candidatus Micrarchaeota archaeon]|nr:RnfABCDGE type electron transport complex subunit D [Candidatus Micrarchaeota archaeon]
MRILGQPVGRMYITTIILLSSIAAISSYTLRIVPYPLLLAVLVSSLLEIAIARFHFKRSLRVPYSAIVTGLIIGSIAPPTGSMAIVLVASAFAVFSKFFIKMRGSNIFNPAALGLIIALPIFGAGDQWWAASNYNILGIAVSLTLVLVITAYEARRLTAAASFVLVSLISTIAIGGISHLSPIGILAAFFSINFYFAFVMLCEPKTSPNSRYHQIAFGASIAILYIAIGSLRISYPLLIALLLGNAAYALYRVKRR